MLRRRTGQETFLLDHWTAAGDSTPSPAWLFIRARLDLCLGGVGVQMRAEAKMEERSDSPDRAILAAGATW